MKFKALFGSVMAVALLGVGMLAGSVVGPGRASAQVPAAAPAVAAAQAPAVAAVQAPAVVAAAQAPAARVVAAVAHAPAAKVVAQTRSARAVVAQATTPTAGQTAPAAPSKGTQGTITAAITKQQAEQAALAANAGATVDHTQLTKDANGTAIYDVDFTNGGGAIVNATTGAVISSEAAGTDKGGGPRGGGGADQAALLAKATVKQADAEKAALAANPGVTVDHSRLGQDASGTIFWDVDFSNGGGATVNATTGAIIANEAAGTDHGPNGGPKNHTNGTPPSTAPNGSRHSGRSAASFSAP